MCWVQKTVLLVVIASTYPEIKMIPDVTQDLINALKNQEQTDMDGTYCKVSRQAVDEAIMILQELLDGKQS